MTPHANDDLVLRPATPDDTPALLALLRETMGRSDDPRFEPFLRWKHFDNPFGASYAWVACDGDRIAAVRFLMRWEFDGVHPDRVARAVRAVDTATHPDYQGRGLFTKLTLGAIEALRAEGTDFVFNTPNDNSRPGYLKMGWQLVGVLPVRIRPLHGPGVLKMVRSRVPAGHFSVATTAGEPAATVLADDAGVRALLARGGIREGIRTHVTPELLRWRYGTDVIGCRAVSGSDGLALFRMRARGAAREVSLEALLPDGGPDATRRLVRSVLRATRRDGDFATAIGASPGFVTLPRNGPTLTWRAVAADAVFPPLDRWRLQLGDVELF